MVGLWKHIFPTVKELIISIGSDKTRAEVANALVEKFDPEVIKFNDSKIMKLRENIRSGHGT